MIIKIISRPVDYKQYNYGLLYVFLRDLGPDN